MSQQQACAAPQVLDVCPTADDLLPQILALTPRGRAWGNNDGGPFAGVLLSFWTVLAHILAYVNTRICDLKLEFFCATANETLDVWDAQYGLPDDCDPFPDLCLKVAAQGGARCEFYQAICASAGWVINCESASDACGGRYGNARFGCFSFGAIDTNELRIVVETQASTAYVPPGSLIPRFGAYRFGQPRGCGEPNIQGLQCLIERVAPAHAVITYVLA